MVTPTPTPVTPATPPSPTPPIVATPAPPVVPVAIVTPAPAPAPIDKPPVSKRKARPVAPPTATPPVLHTVMVNVTPGWAYFTVDDGADQLQTLATIKLALGAHVIHFARGELHRDVSIEVHDDDQLKVVVDLSH